MNIIITLAGHSRRFKEKNYNKPKFLLKVNNHPIIYYVSRMFDIEQDIFYFVLNKEQKKNSPEIVDILYRCAKNVKITEIEPHEEGPVKTAFLADIQDKKNPVIISYCDFVVQWNYKKFLEQVKTYDGGIPSFRGFHPASFGNTYYAYTRQNKNNELIELREKRCFTNNRSEEFANAGIYYFKSYELFGKYAKKNENISTDNLKEGYVSLLFNSMILDNHKVKIFEVEKFVCFGTPEDLEEYYKWENIIKQNKIPALTTEFDKKSYKFWKEFFENGIKLE